MPLSPNQATAASYVLVIGSAAVSIWYKERRRSRPQPIDRLMALETALYGTPTAQAETEEEPRRTFKSCLAFGIPVLLLLSLPLWFEDFPPGR